MTIVLHRPVRIRDIEALRSQLGLSAADMAWLLGIVPAKWCAMFLQARLAPESWAEPCHALLVRWLSRHPEQSPTLYPPTAGDFLLGLRRVGGNVTLRAVALALGRDPSAGYRWFRNGAPVGPDGRRAIALIHDAMPARFAANWSEWRSNMETEADLRGIDLRHPAGWSLRRQAQEFAL
ncbi:hypothetical protein [Magnetospirillum sp. UT-4]|uniref:hypothetical protein n=1 Tax=Magnetospirillum sp. UT-4 TaxID=2681467 RepID=UPI001380400B|nr:hypothetical protein [Magnetospirillum sp. UT-4]CAA7627224.1 conserved hypothetical protein [Magnetospirillum sp. UT-4]